MDAVEREVFIRGFTYQVKVVVVRGKAEPLIFLSTDLSLSATQIIELYSARFSIELAIRDVKQHFGLADIDSQLGIAIDRFVNLAYLAYLAYSLFGLFHREHDSADWMPQTSATYSQWSLGA